MAEHFGIFAAQWVDEDGQELDSLPVLDEALLRARLAQLGAELGEGENEGCWLRGSVAYDFLLCRGSDGRLRMMDGSMNYLSPTAASTGDARAVFTGLYELAGELRARLWLTGGSLMPEPQSAADVEWWIRQAGDVP
ncbi:hypothetical protein CLV92_108136 [Kineococcus xinjiangensis]|uniref:Uncharacterized protein n=1 Tax=Kineococcus xinjiangensis TaxID=512762 RepID=A0A2S6IJ32_9ACTN|nr:hypothetical protein [Kineococcus xinjiangensis]PPK94234.1 hypothetical protein CLV92_108136 [Kineococcus xinjiangensis]